MAQARAERAAEEIREVEEAIREAYKASKPEPELEPEPERGFPEPPTDEDGRRSKVYLVSLDGTPFYGNGKYKGTLVSPGCMSWYSFHVFMSIDMFGRTPFLTKALPGTANDRRSDAFKWARRNLPPIGQIARRTNSRWPGGGKGQWDEYPFASTNEGGAGSHVALIPEYDNQFGGQDLTAFYNSERVTFPDAFQVQPVL